MDAKHFIIVDLEATCCNDGSIPREEQETIEIGAVAIPTERLILGREFGLFVRPVQHPILTDFCKELTGITQNLVDSASKFPFVWMLFNQWCRKLGADSFYSWGDFDKQQLERDCAFHKQQLGFQHHNLAFMFRKQIGSRRRFGHRRAMKRIGIEPKGRHHRGIDDAKNIAQVALWLFKQGVTVG